MSDLDRIVARLAIHEINLGFYYKIIFSTFWLRLIQNILILIKVTFGDNMAQFGPETDMRVGGGQAWCN